MYGVLFVRFFCAYISKQMEKKLTIKQEKFCQKYHECGNASEAYRYAYDCRKMKDETITNSAHKLLNNGDITARVGELQAELKNKSDITKEMVLKELASVGFASIAHYHNTWLEKKDFESLPEAQRSAIKVIKSKSRRTMIGDEPIEIEFVEIELHDKLKALERICKMLGFDAPIKTENKTELEISDPYEVARLLYGFDG